MAKSRFVGSSEKIVKRNFPCAASVFVGSVVRISAGIAVNALASSALGSRAVGIVEKKSSSTLCDIVFAGPTDTIFAGLDDSKDYFLDPLVAGAITTTVPIGTAQVVLRVGRPLSATEMVVMIGTRLQRAL